MKLSEVFRQVREYVENSASETYVCLILNTSAFYYAEAEEAKMYIADLLEDPRNKKYPNHGVREWLMKNHPYAWWQMRLENPELDEWQVGRLYRLAWLDHIISELEGEGR